MGFVCPNKECRKCLRLAEFRDSNEIKFPKYYNGPVPSFGDLSAEILVVGLAPGLHGANQTGRPFTNDYAGDVLYPILKDEGLARGEYKRIKDDGFELCNVRVSNAVRCVPPLNKPTTEEEKICRQYLKQEIESMKNLKVILSLGTISHKNVLSVLEKKQSLYKFSHAMVHNLGGGIMLVDSYHTSRYNINTGVLTEDMFREVIRKIKELI
ncbi:MAG: uracil-DNA glycosylase [Alphaproteobacteria bacterium]|nr:uracil-DNA glycosylase [Alphaproteobacteria bacterium]